MRPIVRGVLAGLSLAAIEIAIVALRDRGLFLSSRELGRYALLALGTLPLLGAASAWIGSWISYLLARDERMRALRVAVFALSAPLVAWLVWSLTEGRRVRNVPGRPLLALALGVAAGVVLAAVTAWLRRNAGTRSSRTRAAAIALLLLAIACVAIDATVLRRLYPAFHAGLGFGAWLAVLAAFVLVPPVLPRAAARFGGLALAALGALAAFQWTAALRNPGLLFSIEQAAPHTGKLIAWRTAAAPEPHAPDLRAAPAAAPAAPSAAASKAAARAGVDLRDRDVLLITIDALRADRLSAYGGRGLTPAIDKLAADARVFLRAYTPTPHTSYAVMSMLSGKPLALLYALGGVHNAPVTLPQLLRKNGYRTAAFYPPAIFYVDEDRFSALAEDHMGFEYVKAQYATASERVDELRAYLQGADRTHPLFVWVHLFEPHEPYEPPARFAQGDSAEQRYDGEVAAADFATGEIVELFRAARPGATVILAADHGEEHGEHGGYHHGTTLFDEQARVPLIWSSPGAISAGSTRAPVELLDIPTTLLGALGIPKDARMQGDDVGAVLADASAPGPAFAFASLPELSMSTDGALKLLCAPRSKRCQLFDLDADPRERSDLSGARASDVTRLRGAWESFVAQVPVTEALDISGQAWPAALARGRLGDASVVPELIALLGAARPQVRAEAAAVLGELRAAQARPVLARMLAIESDPAASAQIAIAALRLGYDDAHLAVTALLGLPEAPGKRKRVPADAEHGDPDAPPPTDARHAAVALAEIGDARGETVLLASAASIHLSEPERIAALRALAQLGEAKALSRAALPQIAKLFSEVRLREEVAHALRRCGDKRAIAFLREALRKEEYPGAIHAEAEALRALGDGATLKRLMKPHEARAKARALDAGAAD